jgi:hypothetical protein
MAERNGKNGKSSGRSPARIPKTSTLGQRLRELSDKALASGTKTLSHAQIQNLVWEIRGGRQP